MIQNKKYSMDSAVIVSLLVGIVVIIPMFTDSRSVFNLITNICIMGVFAMSYNILLGYTGIISLGHALFFGTGAYCVGIAMKSFGPTLWALALAVFMALILAVLAGLVTGYLSLRVKDIYYAMITLAFAEMFFVVGEKWRDATGGTDGISFRIPEMIQNKVVLYYLLIVFSFLMLILAYQLINSPVGRVLQAIRENEQRAEALGYNVLHYKLISNVFAGIMASLAGTAFAISQKFANTGTLTIEKTLDALLMTIIGGAGTLLGPFIGSAVMFLLRDWLATLGNLHPLFERWYIFFGLLYILLVLFMPGGVMGAYSRVKTYYQFRKKRSDTGKEPGLKL